jgi:hypothetical protein
VSSHAKQTPGHLIRQAAESCFSLPVGTDKKVLRRPVSGIFRQKGAQFLLPLHGWVSHRPQMPVLCEVSDGSAVGVARPRAGGLPQPPGP